MELSIIPELDRKGLRDFGVVTGSIVAGLFGLALPWLFELTYPLWPWAVFVVLAVWGVALPETLRPVYRIWMRFGLLLSKVTTPLIMGVVFFLLIVPVAFALRLLRWDAMNRVFEPEVDSYRVESASASRESLEKPF